MCSIYAIYHHKDQHLNLSQTYIIELLPEQLLVYFSEISEDSDLIFMKNLKVYGIEKIVVDLNQIVLSKTMQTPSKSVNLWIFNFLPYEKRKVTWIVSYILSKLNYVIDFLLYILFHYRAISFKKKKKNIFGLIYFYNFFVSSKIYISFMVNIHKSK